MELNNLPEDYDAGKLGPQKRQTKFESEEAKLQYDARNLIAIEQAQYEKTGERANPVIFARRKDNDIEALRTAIAKQQTAVEAISVETVAPAEAQKRELSLEDAEQVLQLLKTRFQASKNENLCPELDWSKAEKALKATPEALWSAFQMERTGHEPGVYFSDKTGFDVGILAKETPLSTRNCVYDAKAEALRRENYPDDVFNGNAESQAKAIGVDLQTIEQGRHIARNTLAYSEQGWRWYKTPGDIRGTGSALYGVRFGYGLNTFQYNADFHDAYRGWGGSLRVNFVD